MRVLGLVDAVERLRRRGARERIPHADLRGELADIGRRILDCRRVVERDQLRYSIFGPTPWTAPEWLLSEAETWWRGVRQPGVVGDDYWQAIADDNDPDPLPQNVATDWRRIPFPDTEYWTELVCGIVESAIKGEIPADAPDSERQMIIDAATERSGVSEGIHQIWYSPVSPVDATATAKRFQNGKLATISDEQTEEGGADSGVDWEEYRYEEQLLTTAFISERFQIPGCTFSRNGVAMEHRRPHPHGRGFVYRSRDVLYIANTRGK